MLTLCIADAERDAGMKNLSRKSDTINRQAAIDAILHNQEVYSNNFGNDPIDKYTIAIIDNDAQTIAQLPSAQPERKKGKWIKEDSIYETVTCSVCHGVRRDNRIKHINFCNCCGADMRGEQE